MSSLDKTPEDETSEPVTPEERLRQLLTAAVEPVQPGPGAQARLQAKIRLRGRRERNLPKRLRWSGAILGAAAVVAGIVVIGIEQPGSDGSSASSAANGASADTRAPETRKLPSAIASLAEGSSTARGSRAAPPEASPSSQAYAPGSGTGGVAEPDPGGAQAPLSAGSHKSVESGGGVELTPSAPQALPRSDLDGDGVSDQLKITGGRLVVQFAKSTQSVALPEVGSGARVLGVANVQNAQGGPTAVAFVRVRADSAHAYDTMVALVAGKLTVLQLDGKPVILTVSGTQGYACGAPLIIKTAGQDLRYLVKGASLIVNGPSDAGRPGVNCGFS